MKIPSPEQIKQARLDAGITQTQAAELIYKTCRAWQQWEAGDRAMDQALFELFCIKSNKIKQSTSAEKSEKQPPHRSPSMPKTTKNIGRSALQPMPKTH